MKAFWIAALAIMLLGCVGSADIQVGAKVADTDGNPIEGASVIFSPISDNGYSLSLKTGADGSSYGFVAPGAYTVSASKDGYLSDVEEGKIFSSETLVSLALEKKAA